jgi:F0F1-type ATP synthase assembly protein I
MQYVMYKTVVLQLAAILIVAALVGFWLGERDAISVLLGGAAYLVPNALFVVRLSAGDFDVSAKVLRRAVAGNARRAFCGFEGKPVCIFVKKLTWHLALKNTP